MKQTPTTPIPVIDRGGDIITRLGSIILKQSPDDAIEYGNLLIFQANESKRRASEIEKDFYKRAGVFK